MKKPLIAFASLVVALAVAGPALADGGPANSVAGPDGVTTPKAGARYITLSTRGSTIVEAVNRAGGQVLRWRSLRGRFEVPAVTLNGAPGGLSADGRRLVLIHQTFTFPQRNTTLAIFDTAAMRVSRMVRFRGMLSFDAISPDGRLVYLIKYASPLDQTQYAVRAYDTATGRLLKKPVVDPHEPGEKMNGSPIARAYSLDGRWAYTLYDAYGKPPFVHALDTTGATARCIDVPLLRGRGDLYELHLSVAAGGGTLVAAGAHGPVAVMDTRTFRVAKPSRRAAAAHSADSGGGGSWMPFVFAGLLLTGAVAALGLRRRRRLATG